MSGRLHVIHGDLSLLDCDVALVPTDALLRIEPTWHELVTEEEARSGAPEGWEGGAGSRSFLLPPREVDGPSRLLLEVATEGSKPVEWYVEGVREALQGCHLPDAAAGRCRPLVGLPLVGTGLGGSAGQRGALIPPMLDVLEGYVGGCDVDAALVTYDRPDYAAVQSARVERGRLPDPFEEHAQRLADLAVRGDLVPFIGAGVSASAGLPAWWDLLERVADAANLLEEDEREGGQHRERLRENLHALGTLDAAELMRSVLGTEAVKAVARELDADRHALAHGLLASLRAPRAATTNYDRLFELASRRPLADQGGLAVLPWDPPDVGRPWLVKMHGDVERPDSIVLSRGDLVSYDSTRKPLASLLQAQMLTGHMLFVGSSMTDDALVQLAWEVRELFAAWDAPVRVVGTVLGMREEPLRARLWEDVLRFVPLAGMSTAAGDGDPDGDSDGDPRDGLPTFLDRLAQLASRERSYLLDPRYEGLVTDDLRPVREALLALGEALDELPRDADPTVVDRTQGALRAFGWDPDQEVTGRGG